MGLYAYPLQINEQGKIRLKGDDIWVYEANRTIVMQYRLNATGVEVDLENSTIE
jgi:hypothetical protein